MKFVLIECIEREINTPDCFKSHEEAYKEMRKRMAEALSIEPEELEEFEDWGDEVGISCDNNSAWITDYHHNNYDWKIFEVKF